MLAEDKRKRNTTTFYSLIYFTLGIKAVKIITIKTIASNHRAAARIDGKVNTVSRYEGKYAGQLDISITFTAATFTEKTWHIL